MFADTHLMDVTRLAALGQPLPYIFFVIPFLFALTRTPCLFRPGIDLLTSNKPVTTPKDPRFDQPFLLGIVAGTCVLLQSNVASMVYLCAGLIYSTLTHRPL